MYRIASAGVLVFALGLAGCDKSDEPSGGAGGGGSKATGFDTPQAAFDAYLQAVKDKNEQAYMGIIAANPKELSTTNDMIAYTETQVATREEAVKEVITMTAVGLGMDDKWKQFPVEVDGDSAFGIVLKPETRLSEQNIKYRKIAFEKKDGKWYFKDSTFGPIADLDASKYKWDGGS